MLAAAQRHWPRREGRQRSEVRVASHALRAQCAARRLAPHVDSGEQPRQSAAPTSQLGGCAPTDLAGPSTRARGGRAPSSRSAAPLAAPDTRRAAQTLRIRPSAAVLSAAGQPDSAAPMHCSAATPRRRARAIAASPPIGVRRCVTASVTLASVTPCRATHLRLRTEAVARVGVVHSVLRRWPGAWSGAAQLQPVRQSVRRRQRPQAPDLPQARRHQPDIHNRARARGWAVRCAPRAPASRSVYWQNRA